MVKPALFLCLLVFAIVPASAQAQDQDDDDGAYEGSSAGDPPEEMTTIIVRIDRNSSPFPRSQLPTSQLPQSQLPESTAFPTER
jgi:hypothetical protein